MPSINYESIDLGEGHLSLPKIITANENGRRWFARGCLHNFNYNHEEAIKCFGLAIEADPKCMMAYWGTAYALSSTYNFIPGLGCGYDAMLSAIRGIESDEGSYTEIEKDLIRALAKRSTLEAKDAVDPSTLFFGNTPELNKVFADEMGKLYEKYGSDNIDIVWIYAESLMVLNAWGLWRRDEVTGKIAPADQNTLIIKEVLEKALKTTEGSKCPGVLHLYIHLMELSDNPEVALPAADTLANLLPMAGHLLHMPGHIYIWAGEFKKSVDSSSRGVQADNITTELTGIKSNFYYLYRVHNYHFVVWSAMFTGEKEIAMKFCREMETFLAPDESGVQYLMEGCIPLGALMMESYSMTKWHAMIRFGMWEEILAEQQYKDATMYPTGVASGHYARGMAYAALGLIAEAEAEQEKYAKDMRNPALEGRMIHNNAVMSMEDPCVLKVGESMLSGEIEYRKGNYAIAFEHLREAVRHDMGLKYDEPWGWMQPTRHALGALLLEQDHVEEATEVFRVDVKLYRDNMWGLLGLFQCLEKAGDPQADIVKQRYTKAAEHADSKPSSSCFCARGTDTIHCPQELVKAQGFCSD